MKDTVSMSIKKEIAEIALEEASRESLWYNGYLTGLQAALSIAEMHEGAS